MDAETPANVIPDEPHAPPPLPPFSALAITAFVLSFITGFAGLVGFWEATLIPIALGILAVVLIRKTGKRGHLLAMFGILIAGAFGIFSYYMHSKGADAFLSVPQGMVAVLTDESKDAAAKDKALEAWAWKAALEADAQLMSGWREGFDTMVETYGPVQGTVAAGDHVPGFMAMIVPPKHGDEINPTTDADPPAPGGAIWSKLTFEKATVWLCVVLGTAEDDGREAAGQIVEDEPSPVAGGMRYFHLD